MDIRGFDPKKTYQPLDAYVCDNRAQTYISHGDKIKPGVKVEFKPVGGLGFEHSYDGDCTMTGKIVYINHEHAWFSVEYGDDHTRTSFTFGDIGDTVHFCEED